MNSKRVQPYFACTHKCCQSLRPRALVRAPGRPAIPASELDAFQIIHATAHKRAQSASWSPILYLASARVFSTHLFPESLPSSFTALPTPRLEPRTQPPENNAQIFNCPPPGHLRRRVEFWKPPAFPHWRGDAMFVFSLPCHATSEKLI